MKTSGFGAWCGQVILVLGLAACGGGGGGGDSATPATSGTGTGAAPGTGSTAGALASLMPAAPTAGATLYADAAILRPVRDGAVWSYRGEHKVNAMVAARYYVTTTTQATTGTAAASETFSNSGNTGPDTQAIAIVNGSVGGSVAIDLTGKAPAETVQFVELKSPVRQGEQYNILDRRYTDTAIDADRDGRTDTLDVAIYVRVVGNEPVTLRNLPTLTALRVDTMVRTRVIYSGTGLSAPVVEINAQVWYAPGIGIVRQLTSGPSSGGNSVETSDERLESWDGISSGFGAMAPREARLPAGTAAFAGQALPGNQLFGSAAFTSHALVATALPGMTPSNNGVLFSRLDLRGRVESSVAHPALQRQPGDQYVGHPGGMLLVRLGNSVTGALGRVELTRFDSNGTLQGAVGAVQIDLSGGRSNFTIPVPAAAVDGTTLWLLWIRVTSAAAGTTDELLLRPYALDGSPLAAEIRMDDQFAVNPTMAVGDGQVVAAWTRSIPGVGLQATVATVAAGATVSARLILNGAVPSSPGPLPVLRLGARSAVFWQGMSRGVSTDGKTGGLLVDAAAQPIHAPGSSLTTQPLPDISLTPSPLGALASRLVSTQQTQGGPFDQLWPGDLSSPGNERITWYDTGNTPLTAVAPKTVTMANMNTQAQVVFADRVLLISSGPTMRTAVVWLR